MPGSLLLAPGVGACERCGPNWLVSLNNSAVLNHRLQQRSIYCSFSRLPRSGCSGMTQASRQRLPLQALAPTTTIWMFFVIAEAHTKVHPAGSALQIRHGWRGASAEATSDETLRARDDAASNRGATERADGATPRYGDRANHGKGITASASTSPAVAGRNFHCSHDRGDRPVN